jgi:tetratricopeptide (TPR) repeat protein
LCVKRFWFITAAVSAFLLSFWPGHCVKAQTGGGHQPHAQSQQELEDYRAASTLGGGAALEQAALAFAQKYPQSELRAYLFSRAMREYQRENNPGGVLSAGQAVLAIDANDPLALVLTSTVMADSLAPDDADRDRKINTIKRNISRALQSLTTKPAPAGLAQGQTPVYKSTLESMAYATLGLTRLKTGDYGEAERDLKTAVDLAAARPDPFVWYHLALAQDHRKKYPAALNSVEQALQLASANPELQRLAETEHERLTRLTGRNKQPAEGESSPPQRVPDL